MRRGNKGREEQRIRKLGVIWLHWFVQKFFFLKKRVGSTLFPPLIWFEEKLLLCISFLNCALNLWPSLLSLSLSWLWLPRLYPPPPCWWPSISYANHTFRHSCPFLCLTYIGTLCSTSYFFLIFLGFMFRYETHGSTATIPCDCECCRDSHCCRWIQSAIDHRVLRLWMCLHGGCGQLLQHHSSFF